VRHINRQIEFRHPAQIHRDSVLTLLAEHFKAKLVSRIAGFQYLKKVQQSAILVTGVDVRGARSGPHALKWIWSDTGVCSTRRYVSTQPARVIGFWINSECRISTYPLFYFPGRVSCRRKGGCGGSISGCACVNEHKAGREAAPKMMVTEVRGCSEDWTLFTCPF